MTINVARLLAENVSALLRRHGYTNHALAMWCKRSDPWVSDFINKQKGWKIEDLDRVADLFGLEPYQLFIPGIVERSERRRGNDRRSDKDRRLNKEQRIMMPTVANIDAHHPRRKGLSDVASASLQRVLLELQGELKRILDRESSAREDARITSALTDTRRRLRGAARSDTGQAKDAD